MVVNKALFVLNYFKLEVFKAKRRTVLGMGDYRQFNTNINSYVRLEHLYEKVPHRFHIKLKLQQQNPVILFINGLTFERKTYIISCIQYFTQKRMQPGVMKRHTWATKVPQRIKTSAVVHKFSSKSTTWVNFAVNYCKNTSFMNTEFVHDKYSIIIATTGSKLLQKYKFHEYRIRSWQIQYHYCYYWQ